MHMPRPPRVVHVITDAASPPPNASRNPRRVLSGLRVVLALLVLLVTALDAWLTAMLGTRPLIPAVYRALALFAREARAWADGIPEADLIDDPDREVRP